MNKSGRLLLLFIVAIIGVTQFYRQDAHSVVDDAYSRILAVTLDPTLVPTNPTRTTTSQLYCSKPRNELISSTERETTAGYFATLDSYFKFDALSVISLAATGNIGGLTTAAQPAVTGIGIYIVPFAIGLILSLTLWLCLCCCCTCPGCCPSKCCQHDENLLYTKCELLWPSIFLMLTLLLGAAACVPGITRASIMGDSIKTMQCGIALTLDDILNGNITQDGSTFFIGLTPLSTKLVDLRNNVTDIIGNLTGTVQSGSANVAAACVSSKTGLETVADTTANTSYAGTYTSPTPGSPATLPSGFATVLGDPTQSSTAIGIMYTVFEQLRSTFDNLSTQTSSLSGATASIQSGIDGVVTTLSNFTTIISDADTSIGSTAGTADTYLEYLKYGFLGFYGAGIGIAVLGLLGVVIMSCFDKPGCRYLVYFSCVIMFILCIVGFLISFFMSLIIPVLYLVCSTINTATASSAAFVNFTTSLNLDANISGTVSVCLPGGNGSIISQFDSSGTFTGQLDSITGSLSVMDQYRTYDVTVLTGNVTDLQTKITDFRDANINDITYEPGTLTYFKELANRTRYATNCVGDAEYDADSIVPSFGTTSLGQVPCFGGATHQTSSNLASSPAGCLSLFDIFTNNGGSLLADLTSRYGATCAADIEPDFTAIMTNWHTPRTTDIGGVLTRFNTVNTADIADISGNLTTLVTDIDTAYLALNTTVNNLIDPTYGVLQGINCLLMGEDLITMKDTICVTLFNSFYFLFATIGCASFAFLFSMCCAVCSGVRHYKQSEKKSFKAIGADSNAHIGINNRAKF